MNPEIVTRFGYVIVVLSLLLAVLALIRKAAEDFTFFYGTKVGWIATIAGAILLVLLAFLFLGGVQ